MTENILIENPNRFVLKPIQHPDIFEFFKKAESAMWTADEIDLTEDTKDWANKLNDNERFFISNILQFFAASDGIVNENLAINFLNDVQYPEAKFFYGCQIHIENVHSESYSNMIEAFITDPVERQRAFESLQYNPIVQKKGQWALNWISNGSFAEKLIAFVAVEGIFFAGSFCSIFWLKDRNLMPGLCAYNELISRDETLHYQFAAHLYKNHISNKLSEAEVKKILLWALDIEKEFVKDSLPVTLIGMSSDLMIQYLEYVVDNILIMLGYASYFNVENPFPFMSKITLEHKTNFHEHRPTQYQKAKIGDGITFDVEF